MGWAGALPLLGVQGVFVCATWLMLREQTPERCAMDYHLAVGSLPLLVCLFWWTGENRPLNPVLGFDLLDGPPTVPLFINTSAAATAAGHLFWELSAARHLHLWAICALDHFRGLLSAKLVTGTSHRFFVALELVALAVSLLSVIAFSHELVSVAGILLLASSFIGSFMFVSASSTDAVKRK
jgi:hypothetical protein